MSGFQDQERICVVGLGYVGLPLAIGLAQCGYEVLGFDISSSRVAELKQGHDRTDAFVPDEVLSSGVKFTSDEQDIVDRSMFIVTVPTPVDENRQPDLRPVADATRTVGRHLSVGACVVYESTVYPGVTEDLCRPLLAEISGLRPGVDFTVGYSPERINPGDKEHTLQSIVKVVSGEDAVTLERVSAVYSRAVTAGIYKATSIKVAEAAKVIENTQRDLNIALMNEFAMIFDHMGISTRDVLNAAGSKWNFLRFTPGLVGGHCIGVDPYYLTAKAEQMGYHPAVILAGRRINDSMGRYVARRLVKALISKRIDLRDAKIAVLGITFKDNVPDIRNTRIVDTVSELRTFSIEPYVVDPIADPAAVKNAFDIELRPLADIPSIDAVVIAVAHCEIVAGLPDLINEKLNPEGIVYDLKAAANKSLLGPGVTYMAL